VPVFYELCRYLLNWRGRYFFRVVSSLYWLLYVCAVSLCWLQLSVVRGFATTAIR
jgi:hypothetical protein